MTEQRIYNLSPRVLSLAQRLDMLPPGEYIIKLVKPEITGISWHAEIVRTETLCVVELAQRSIVLE